MNRRRLWPLVAVVAVLVGGRLFLRRSVDATVVVELPAPAVRLELLFVRADDADKRVVRDVTLAAPAAHVEKAVRLPQGSYDVTARFGAAMVVRPLLVDGAGRYVLDLR